MPARTQLAYKNKKQFKSINKIILPFRKRHTAEDYNQLAELREFLWIETELPLNVLTPTKWQCKEKHTWTTSYNSIQKGSNCPTCVSTKKTEQDYQKLANQRGFQWIGNILPSDILQPTMWQCKHEHTWSARYNGIKHGSGCPHCAGVAPRIEADYRELAQQRGFRWVGKILPPNVRTLTRWQCLQGHLWKAAYGSIHSGTGCPRCRKNAPKTRADYKKLAKQRQ